jgi:hypothetical protein
MAGDLNLGAQQAAAGLANGGKRFGKEIVQTCGQLFLVLALQLVEAVLQAVALNWIGAAMFRIPDTIQLGLDTANPLRQAFLEASSLGLEVGFSHILEPFLMSVDLLHHRLDALALAVEAGAEDRCHQCLDHSGSKYNW